MEKSQEFLMLLRDYKHLEETLKAKAWEITPPEVKELLVGKGGLFGDGEEAIDAAVEFLIMPGHNLRGKSYIEAILDGDIEKVKGMINRIIDGVFS